MPPTMVSFQSSMRISVSGRRLIHVPSPPTWEGFAAVLNETLERIGIYTDRPAKANSGYEVETGQLRGARVGNGENRRRLMQC